MDAFERGWLQAGLRSDSTSPRLLRELLGLDRTALQEEERHPFSTLLAATFGSVPGNVPMPLFRVARKRS